MILWALAAAVEDAKPDAAEYFSLARLARPGSIATGTTTG
jgi:hypothetical protein